MNRRALPLALAAAIMRPTAGECWPPPRIPRELIPESMPPEVRRQVERLYSRSESECVSAAHALGAMGPAASAAAPYLISLLDDEIRHGSVGWSAAHALADIGTAAVEPTILAFQFGNHYTRMRALDVFARIRDPRTIPVLVSAVVDGLAASGKNPLDALKTIGPAALDYLLRGASDPSPEVRYAAVLCLPAFPSNSVAEVLDRALLDPDEDVRAGARRAVLTAFERNKDLKMPLGRGILRSLEEGDPSARQAAIDVAVRCADEAKIEAIARLADDEDEGVRIKAVRTLGWIRNERATHALIGLLNSPAARVRATATEAVAWTGQATAAAHLRKLLADPEPAVRERAVLALGILDAPGSAPDLARALDDPDSLVRTRAAEAVGNVRSVRTVETLRAALRDPDKGVRHEALRSLALLYRGEVEMPDRRRRTLPANAELPLYSKAVQACLVESLGDEDITARIYSLEVLSDSRAPRPPVEPIAALLDHADPSVRAGALELLSRLDALPCVETVRARLRDPSHRVRELALSVLASRKDPAALEAAIAGVSGDRNLALVSVRALGSFGAEAVGPLARAMRHLDSDVRHTAASTLARSGQPAAREALALALRDPDRKTRRVAADAILQGSAAERTPEILAELAALSAPDPVDERLRAQLLRAGDRAVDPLARLLGDEEPTVRLTATKLLGDLKQRSALRPLAGMVNDPNPHVRKAAAEALSRLGEPAALPPIRGAVEDGNPEVREAATAALGRCGGAEASEPLARAIRHADWHMRALAASGLGLARPGQTLAPLVEALTDPHWYVRQKAADALTRIGATSEVPALMRALEDDHWSVRRNVLSALREITGQTLSADVSEWKAWLANEPGRPGFQPSGKELE